MSMRKKADNLIDKIERIEKGGGFARIERQHKKGKLTARERLDLLFDKDTFREIDMFVTHRCNSFGMEKMELPAEGVVTGYGQINGRLAAAFSQDFTVSGGSAGEMHENKICKIIRLAAKMGIPCIGLNDSGGARIQEGVDALSGYGKIFFLNTMYSGVIPQISIIMGPCAGGAVYSPALTDFIFMVDKTSYMFITGPQVIKAVGGPEVSAEELGGANTHNKISGNAHFICKDDKDCIENVKTLLSFLPSNNVDDPPQADTKDPISRLNEKLMTLVPNNPKKSYDMLNIIKEIVDNNHFLEIQPFYAPNIIVGFGRLNGKTIGIVANQPKQMAGALDVNSSDKAARFIRFCDAFNIPLINFVDVPGFFPGIEQEYGGIIRHGAKMLYAYSEASVPKITLIIRKAYGGAYLAMCSKDLGSDFVLAWPSAEIAVMGPEGAANIIFRKQIKEASNPVEYRKEMIEEYKNKFCNPYVAAGRGMVDRVILPSETRMELISAIEVTYNKNESRPKKKHGCIPL